MSRIWKTIRSYIWWTHERGSFHYDVMVSLILLFIFLAPHWVNFNDKPTARIPHQGEVVVIPDHGGFIFEISATNVDSGTDAQIRERLVHIAEPIAGEIELVRYEAVRDSQGQLKTYKAWVRKPYR